MVIREKYIKKIRPFYESDLIKIITGIRRCGKSIVLQQVRDEIAAKTDNIIFLEFENRRIKNQIPDIDSLLAYVDEHKKQGKCYIFLDEIQILENWQEACKTLRLENNSVFITGSNSKLLSKEFTKELSGRYVSFRIRPFVYKEILEYAKELNKEISITDYLVWGGFPKRLEFDNDAIKDYLYDLDETIIHNDIMVRYNIQKENLFRSVCNFVFRSNSRIISSKSIADFLSSNNEKCSVHTVSNYIYYIEEAFGIDRIKPFSTRTKNELSYYHKTYNADVALNSLRCTDSRYDLDHNLENIVYNELLYMDYNLKVFNDTEREVDFVAERDGKKYFIQVAFSVQNEKAYEREFRAFANLDNLSQKILITTDELDYSTSVVRHIKLKDFLLMEDL
ncbi:MAG: ATP-binding protein [Treponema sp.]|nr:ATP-binding protein [Treponema sp.]